jgi:uncharacterized protein with PIN domain
MIVVDSSAIVALLRNEPRAPELAARLALEPLGERRMSAASYLETGAVMAGAAAGDRLQVIADLDAYLARIGVTLEGVDENAERNRLFAVCS